MTVVPLESAVVNPEYSSRPTPMSPVGDASLTSPAAPADCATCANCDARLVGAYCAACGAPALDRRPLTIRRFARDLMNEVTNVDSFTMRTLHSLFVRPGELTKAYLDGKTRWYLSPLRLYLVLFAVFVVLSALMPDQEETYTRVATLTTLKVAAQRREVLTALARSGRTPSIRDRALLDMDPVRAADQSVRALRFVNESQWVQVINAFLWAAVLALLYRGRRRSYAEHLVFALHLLAFNLLLILANASLRALLHRPPSTSSFDVVSLLHWTAIGTYFYFASRRLYGETPPRAGVKSVLFVAGAQASMLLISTGAFVYAGYAQGTGVHRHPMVTSGAAAPLRAAPALGASPSP